MPFAPTDISGCTLWLDPSYGITADANNRISAWASAVGSISFAQAGTGNKFIKSRSDNLENLMIYSETLSNAAYNKTRTTIGAGPTPPSPYSASWEVTEDSTASATHLIENYGALPGAINICLGKQYRISFVAKYKSKQYINFTARNGFSSTTNRFIDIQNGSLGTLTAGAAYVSDSIESLGGGWYKYTCTLNATANFYNTAFSVYLSNSAGNNITYNGDGTSSIYITGFHVRESSASDIYLANGLPTHQYAGINGLPVPVLDGTDDVMTSVATLGDIISASAATVFVVSQPTTQAANGMYIYDSAGLFYLGHRADAKFRSTLYDGASKTIEAAHPTSSLKVWAYRHAGGQSKLSNYVDAAPTDVAAGNIVGALTGTLSIGGVNTSTQLLNAKLASLLVYNAALTDAQTQLVIDYLGNQYNIDGLNASRMLTTFCG